MIMDEKLFMFKTSEEFFFYNMARILNLKSFCAYVKIQQDPVSGKQGLNTFLFLIQPIENKWMFNTLRKTLNFGEIVVIGEDRSFVLFRIKTATNVEIFLNHTKPFLNSGVKVFDLLFEIFDLRKKVRTVEDVLNLHIKIDTMKQLHGELFVNRPKDLTPSYLRSRMKPIVLKQFPLEPTSL